MKSDYLINSIYRATEGEGVFVGTPQVFIRYQGCSIGCLNCDSKDTWEFSETGQLQLNNIVEKVEQLSAFGAKRVSITGGDPLHPRFVPSLVQLIGVLKDLGYFINIEASGVRIVKEVFDLVDYISFDVKTPSTGVCAANTLIDTLIDLYPGKFQIKSVVANKYDFDFVYSAFQSVQQRNKQMDFPWCITPAYEPGQSLNRLNFIEILHENENIGAPFRVIGQQHKWVYGAEAKQV